MSNARALRGWRVTVRVTAQVLLLGVVAWVLGMPEAQHGASAAQQGTQVGFDGC